MSLMFLNFPCTITFIHFMISSILWCNPMVMCFYHNCTPLQTIFRWDRLCSAETSGTKCQVFLLLYVFIHICTIDGALQKYLKTSNMDIHVLENLIPDTKSSQGVLFFFCFFLFFVFVFFQKVCSQVGKK